MLIRRSLIGVSLFFICACGARGETLDIVDNSSTQLSGAVAVDATLMAQQGAYSSPTPPSRPDVITQVRSDFANNQTYFNQCMLAPAKCDVMRITAPLSPWRDQLTRLVRDYSKANIRAKQGSGVALVRIESASIIDPENASVEACTFDSMVLVDAGASDGKDDDIIFNDAVASYLSTWKLRLDEGTWKWFSWTSRMTKFNVDQCGFGAP